MPFSIKKPFVIVIIFGLFFAMCLVRLAFYLNDTVYFQAYAVASVSQDKESKDRQEILINDGTMLLKVVKLQGRGE